MTQIKAPKNSISVTEAATLVGVSLQGFRKLREKHATKTSEVKVGSTTYMPKTLVNDIIKARKAAAAAAAKAAKQATAAKKAPAPRAAVTPTTSASKAKAPAKASK